jgi:hypothetical protein
MPGPAGSTRRTAPRISAGELRSYKLVDSLGYRDSEPPVK